MRGIRKFIIVLIIFLISKLVNMTSTEPNADLKVDLGKKNLQQEAFKPKLDEKKTTFYEKAIEYIKGLKIDNEYYLSIL